MRTKTEKKTLKWWIVSMLPFVGLYWSWRVSKMLAEQEQKEHSD